MKKSGSMILFLFSLSWLAAPPAQAQDTTVQVVLTKKQQSDKLAQAAKRLFDAALNKRGLRVGDGAMNLEWQIRLEINRMPGREGKAQLSLVASAFDPTTGRKAGGDTDLTESFARDDEAAMRRAMEKSIETMADSMAKQLAQAARHGKSFQINLINAPKDVALKVQRQLQEQCEKSRPTMMTAKRAALVCTSRRLSMPELEAGIRETLTRAFPDRTFKTEKQGNMLVVVFD